MIAVFLKDEMHQKGAKYSCFHLELIFIQDVLVMAYTWCETGGDAVIFRILGLLVLLAEHKYRYARFCSNSVAQE